MFSQINTKTKKHFAIGLAASISFLGLYFLILSLANSFSHAREQFLEMWYLVLILSIGFGLQVGLYVFIKDALREKQLSNQVKIIAASGGVSTGAMIACCLHHLADVMPIIGLSAIALFLTQYQTFFVWIGILSNLVGITMLFEIIQKQQLANGFLKNILFFNVGKIKIFTIAFTALILGIFLIMLSGKKVGAPIRAAGEIAGAPLAKNLAPRTGERGNITFEVTPVSFDLAGPVKFEIKIDTHTGSLGFDLTKISVLEDDRGNKYYPVSWQGPGVGGHHVSGTLLFPKIERVTGEIKLTIKDNDDFEPRIFVWNLKTDF